ncbi:hypothetical protein AALP_AAs44920U000300 [Arabis alpina]|uniref:Mitochondrial glycoprotein family protein n=1 Tax=Arabis alpina TaxID=50452 RepID=A0A087FZL3_ARAAL|nr:hypothetical protein AALP_AAs44920U000300 [Arabis alpina]
MSFALCLRKSASRLASSVCGGRLARVRSISTGRAPGAVDDWISSEQAVLGAINSEMYDPVIYDGKNALDSFFAHRWRDPCTKPKTPGASFPFKVEDIPGKPTVTFTREHNGEHIIVVASMPLLDDDDDDDDDVDGSSNESKDDDDGPITTVIGTVNLHDGPRNESNDDDGVTIPLVVTVTKKSGHSLEFRCMCFTNKLAIDALYVNLPGHSLEDQKVIRGLDDYKGLDENLMKTLNKYLEVRGLDRRTSLTLTIYMLDKVKREYWTHLNYVKAFLEEGKIDS